MTSSVNTKLVSLVFFTVILVSFLLYKAVPESSAHLELDSVGYDRIALNFMHTGALTDPLQSAALIPVQMVGYPLFLGIIYTIFGYNYGYVVLIQVLLWLIIIYLLYQLTQRVFDNKSASIIIFLAGSVGFWVYSQMIMTEIILATFLTSFLYQFFVFWKTYQKTALALAGFFLGLSMIIKPVALFFIPVIALIVVIHLYTNKQNIRALLLFFLLLTVPVSSYMTYNYSTYGQFVLAPLAQENIYHYYLPRLIAFVDQKPLEGAQQIINQTIIEKDKLKREHWVPLEKLLWNTVKQHPLSACYVWLNNVMRSMFGLYSSELKSLLNPAVKGGSCSFFKQNGLLHQRLWSYITYGSPSVWVTFITLYEALWLCLEYVLALLGLWILLKRKQYLITIFFILYISYFLMITGHDGCGRYRMMIEPVLLVLASAGFARLVSYE